LSRAGIDRRLRAATRTRQNAYFVLGSNGTLRNQAPKP
jgi:hypothetical protein